MKGKTKWSLIGVAVSVALVLTAGFAAVASAQGPTPVPPALSTNPWGYGWGPGGMTLAPHASVGVGGFWFDAPSAQMPVTLAQARDNAAQYLKTYLPNTTVEDKGNTFYGYYNFDVLQNGKTYGMLSVNGYTGAVWYHTWHGNFIGAEELD